LPGQGFSTLLVAAGREEDIIVHGMEESEESHIVLGISIQIQVVPWEVTILEALDILTISVEVEVEVDHRDTMVDI
jgi:hypothetical protein